MANYIILQIMISVFVIFAVSRSFLRFRDKNASLTEFLLWTLVWVSVLVVAWAPKITDLPARVLGIGRGIDVVVYVSIVILFYSIYRVYSKIERVDQEITLLTREIALRGKKR